MSNPGESIKLRDFIAILANELRILALAGKQIEERVGDHIVANAIKSDAAHPALQGLDHLVQTANALSHFLDDVAIESDSTLHISVAGPASRVNLRALAEVLQGKASEGTIHSDLVGDGHVDFF
ncbi:MAG: hypothetical protein CFE33_20905 [Pseudorhodobacter sp. PARRP1]|nr:MAG: hypothetical protein CFE33_20905 [Pseudorhodobacter sp. PARRP1]